MSETKHTPGPWLSKQGIVIIDDSGFVLCRLTIFNQHEANARLIAAAPEMLAALREIANSAHEQGIEDIARAAITKAEGES